MYLVQVSETRIIDLQTGLYYNYRPADGVHAANVVEIEKIGGDRETGIYSHFQTSSLIEDTERRSLEAARFWDYLKSLCVEHFNAD